LRNPHWLKVNLTLTWGLKTPSAKDGGKAIYGFGFKGLTFMWPRIVINFLQ